MSVFSFESPHLVALLSGGGKAPATVYRCPGGVVTEYTTYTTRCGWKLYSGAMAGRDKIAHSAAKKVEGPAEGNWRVPQEFSFGSDSGGFTYVQSP